MKKKAAVLAALVAAFAVVLYFTLPGFLVRWARNAERNEAGLTEKSLTVGPHKIVYLEGGKGDSILMVHGFAANKDNWTRFAKFITPTYHVLALDLPGFGDSTCLPEASYTPEAQAKRLDHFATAVGLNKFHIVGNSMGGQIAGRYAIMFPRRVLTLALFDAGGVISPVPSELATRLSRGEPNPLLVKSLDDLNRLINFVFFKPPPIPGFAKKLLVDEALKHAASNARIFNELTPRLGSLQPDLPKINARTLILWGDHDRVLHVSSVSVFQKGLKNCTAVIMKNCGHLPMIERPREAAEHYVAFLKKK